MQKLTDQTFPTKKRKKNYLLPKSHHNIFATEAIVRPWRDFNIPI